MAEKYQARFGSREIRKDGFGAIRAFVANAPRYGTLLMRRAVATIDTWKGWWWGAFDKTDNELRALACIEGTVVNLHGEPDALRAMAEIMLAQQRTRVAVRGQTHQLIGNRPSVSAYWDIFKNMPKRQVLYDRIRNLMATKGPGENPKPSLIVTKATSDDLKVVSAFTAEYMTEVYGVDPIRTGRQAHEDRCRKAISEGRQLIGRDGGKPVFVAEMSFPDDDLVMLDRLHVPKPFRRRKLTAAGLVEAACHALVKGEECLFFADRESKSLLTGAEIAGYEVRSEYRLIVMRS
jgi:hypothetical protein